MTKKTSKIVIKTKKPIKKKKKVSKIHNILGRVLVILIIMGGLWYANQTFSNSVSLLAITENSNGEIVSGSRVDLSLEIKPGTGKIYTDLNTFEEVDTQISIVNSQKIACDLFELDCETYDFFYGFNGSAVILKGPSASSAIGIITAKTVNREKIDKNTVITGSLNSGGIIGNVGGIDKKIEVAKLNNFSKVLIPEFSNYNNTINRSIEVVKVIDIIEAYNSFNGDKFYPKKKELDFTEYQNLMKELSDMMCQRTLDLANQVNKTNIESNSTIERTLNQALKSYNSSLESYSIENYYSAGSFCYNANINYRLIVEAQKDLNLSERVKVNRELKKDLDLRYVITNSQDYRSKILTINDFYVYMLLLDRIEEARNFLKEDKSREVEFNLQDTNQTNQSTLVFELEEAESKNLDELRISYSYALERIYTVDLWEKFIVHNGDLINFDDNKLDEACTKISRENNIKNQLLSQHGVALFNRELNEVNSFARNPFENKYLCIYKGLELSGKMNTVLNAIGINKADEANYVYKILEITQNRLSVNSNGNFPLIPYIYFEYSKDLAKQSDYSSAMLYSNFALTYADLNLYIEIPEHNKKAFLDELVKGLFNLGSLSLVFIVSLLVILGFS